MTDAMAEREYEPVPSGCIPNGAAALYLIRRFSIWGLGGSDGCDCCHFSIHGLQIDVSCRKSEHCVRVSSNCLDKSPKEMIAIASEVLSQIDYPDAYRVRFCDYSHDHVGGHWEAGEWVETYRCVYCHKPRDERDGYLCADHQSDPTVAGRFALFASDWRFATMRETGLV